MDAGRLRRGINGQHQSFGLTAASMELKYFVNCWLNAMSSSMLEYMKYSLPEDFWFSLRA